ncbi:FCD domain-containing protein [bacterium]|nr:FCD domain-containing protein [bacterium]
MAQHVEFSKKAGSSQLGFQDIITKIKKDILLQHYRLGDSLPKEETLAREFGVGRALVREALGVLKAQGYLEARRGSGGGTFVCDLLHSQGVTTLLSDLIVMRSMSIKHLCDVRILIEPEAARLAALESTPAQLRELRDLVFKGQTTKDNHERINLDVEFHKRVGELSGNPFLALLLNNIMGFLKQYLDVLGKPTTEIHDKDSHSELCEAIASHNHQTAYESMYMHVVTMKKRFCSLEDQYLKMHTQNLQN